MAALHARVEAAGCEHDGVRGRLDVSRARLKECDEEICGLERQRGSLVGRVQVAEQEARWLENK